MRQAAICEMQLPDEGPRQKGLRTDHRGTVPITPSATQRETRKKGIRNRAQQEVGCRSKPLETS